MKKWKKALCGILTASLMLPAVAWGDGSSVEAASGSWQHNSKGWWYSYSDGSYAKSAWVQYEGNWYYFEATGYMATGWKKLDGKWYYFEKSGAMKTGWKKYDGKWYYLEKNGVMKTGWRKLDGKWYYFEKSGAMKTGWRKLDGKWYYFEKSGVMKTGWRKLDGKWYYFNKSGAMADGWKKLDGNWYYFDNGAMVTGEKTINGVVYVFDESGVWTGPVEEDLPTKLKKLDGVISVEKVDNLSDFYSERYMVVFEQPLDWSDPSKGTFPQRVLLGFRKDASVNVLETYGYSLPDIVSKNPEVLGKDELISDLALTLEGNMILVESRFSGGSRPEGISNDDTNYWEYLTSENASNDYHRIYQSLSKVLGDVWAATGSSRGGLNTNVYAYYFPEDMKVYVPFAAPCADGMDDDRMYPFVYTEIGNAAYGEEAAAQMRDTVTTFQVEMMRKKDLLLPKLEAYIEQNGLIYRDGVSTSMIYDLWTLECGILVWQYRVVSFDVLNVLINLPEDTDDALDYKLTMMFQVATILQKPDDWAANSTEWPYYVNTATTYGQYRYDFSYLREALQEEGLEDKLTITADMEDDLIRNFVFTEEQKEAFTYDGTFFAALSASMDTTRAKHVMIYGVADPWYCMRIRETENPNVKVFVHPTGNHMPRISSFPEEMQNDIKETLEEYLTAE